MNDVIVNEAKQSLRTGKPNEIALSLAFLAITRECNAFFLVFVI
jgi:hypothetical protein